MVVLNNIKALDYFKYSHWVWIVSKTVKLIKYSGSCTQSDNTVNVMQSNTTIACHMQINRALQSCHTVEEFCPELSAFEGLMLLVY